MVSDKSRSHKKKDSTGRFAKNIFFILGADKPNSHTVVVDRKAVNWGEG